MDCASALHFLHDEHNITHRKPENVLFDQHKRVKLADFGIAKMFNSLRNTVVCGTDRFKSAELLRCPTRPNHDAKKIDFWGWRLLCCLVHTKTNTFLTRIDGATVPQTAASPRYQTEIGKRTG